MIIEHHDKMTWADAIDKAYSKGLYIPNYRQAKELNLVGFWTSTVDHKRVTCALIFGDELPSPMTDLKPVVMINESNYTPDTLSYITGDEGCDSTNE